MKKLSFLLIFAVLLSSISFTSCGKYEEGPGFSVLPKKTRLQQKWRPIETVSSNGTVQELDHNGDYTEFVKGGSLKAYSASLSAGISGTWEFNDDKSGLILTYEAFGVSSTSEMKIIKLKINALGLEDENGNKTYYEYF